MKNFEPLVSVVIPTYRRANLLKRALESVNKQTYENLEVVIVDDSETTKPGNFFDGLERFPIHYIHNEQRNGASAARNQGISKASGSFIAFLDDDDTWEPTKIEKQIELFHHHPQASICITYSHDLRFDHDRINAPPRK